MVIDLSVGLNLVVIVGVIIVLIMNLRTQRAVAAVIKSAERSGPVTDRWTQAILMLAHGSTGESSTVEDRLAAIYSIEQVAQESEVYKHPAMELLAAYIREYARVGRAALEPTTEIQSVLTVLGRSNTEGLDLRRSVLWGADLEGASLVHANFTQGRLRGACLAGASMARARLREASLTDADLVGADLSGAVLRGASLVGADLSGAVLRGADFQGADLTRARLRGADLRDASLVGAHLVSAVLDDADLVGAALDGVDLEGASVTGTILAEDEGRGRSLLSRPANAAPAAR